MASPSTVRGRVGYMGRQRSLPVGKGSMWCLGVGTDDRNDDGVSDGELRMVTEGLWWCWGCPVAATHVYVGDFGNHRVQIFDKVSGAYISQFGSKGESRPRIPTTR
jgi:hypothetical protein